jgi:hypothetical protein
MFSVHLKINSDYFLNSTNRFNFVTVKSCIFFQVRAKFFKNYVDKLLLQRVNA